MEVEKFIKTPEKGQIVKIYLDQKHNYCFGIVKDLYLKRIVRTGRILQREVVVLKRLKKEYPIHKIDYFLELDLVIFL